MDIKSEPVIDTPVDLLSQPVKSERMEDEDAPLVKSNYLCDSSNRPNHIHAVWH